MVTFHGFNSDEDIVGPKAHHSSSDDD